VTATASSPVQVVAVHVWPADADVPTPLDELRLDWGGPVGDRHHGLTMSAGTRQRAAFEPGTVVRNHRQVSIVDLAELARIAAGMGIDHLAPGVIADNIALTGLDDLTAIPAMTRLQFPDGATIMLGGENRPCAISGELVRRIHGTSPGQFVRAAMHRRGVTGWVERPGVIRPGDQVRVLRP